MKYVIRKSGTQIISNTRKRHTAYTIHTPHTIYRIKTIDEIASGSQSIDNNNSKKYDEMKMKSIESICWSSEKRVNKKKSSNRPKCMCLANIKKCTEPAIERGVRKWC